MNAVDGAGSEFDTAMALTGRDGAPGTYDGALGDGWRIGEGVNGGILIGLAARALQLELGEPTPEGRSAHPHPVAISAYYATPGVPGPAVVATEVHRRGGSVSTGSATLSQPVDGQDVVRIRATATYADLAAGGDDEVPTPVPVGLPPPDHCVSTADGATPSALTHATLLQRLDLRLDPATAGWAVGKPSGQGEIRGWLRMADGREPDPLLLLLALDAFPPVAADLGLVGWTPTLELTAHVRRLPVPGWMRVRVVNRTLGGGFLVEDAEVWDADGHLVAVSRQLAMVPRHRR